MSEIPFQNGYQPIPETGSLPDDNTSEAIRYGPAYSWIKSALWAWDEMEDYLLQKADSLESQIIDRRWAYEVLRTNRYLIFSRSPPVNDVRHLKDLFTLHSLYKVLNGIGKIHAYRKKNLAWARMKGIEQYVGGMAGRGISESEWKAATASYNTSPITYDYVNGLTDDSVAEDDFDWNEAMKDLMGDKEYDSLVSKIFGVDVSDVLPDDGEEDGTEGEEKEEDSVPDAREDPLSEALRIMFDDPIGDAMQTVRRSDDECQRCAEWWDLLDIDDRAIIDRLIGFAKEVQA